MSRKGLLVVVVLVLGSGGCGEVADDGSSTGRECRLDRIAFDQFNDGQTDVVTEHDYDEEGRLTRITVDHKTNDNFDEVVLHEYDSEGHRVRTETFQPDVAGADGEPSSFKTYSYDSSGKLIRREDDDDADGETEWVYLYSYDEEGNQVRIDYGRPGETDAIEKNSYDDQDRLVRSRIGGSANGDFNREFTYRYDDEGNRVQKRTFNLGDEERGLVEVLVWEYDQQDRKVRKERYPGPPEGEPESVWRYEHDCT